MDAPFPFGFPAPTAFYLTIYVAALVLHVLFMNYVLAGAAYLALCAVQRPSPPHPVDPHHSNPALHYPATIQGVISDWLPAMLSGAITAGVAPLLFLQILYQREFYTANLLLFSRWMLILPVLIVGFYALYIVQTDWLARQRRWIKALAFLFPFACIAFVGYSWTENHLLSLESPDAWRSFYARDRQLFYAPAILPRLLVWSFGSLPTLCLGVGWQLWYRGAHGDPSPPDEHRRLARLAFLGLSLAIVGGVWYYVASKTTVRALLTSEIALPYFAIALIGIVVQAAAWMLQWRSAAFDRRWLSLAVVGLVGTVSGMTVCREVVRLDALGPTRLAELYPLHAAAANVEGFPVFLAFALINGGLIAFCIRLVRRGWKGGE